MSGIADLELYAFWRTAATHRVRIALNFKGLTARERFVDLDKDEHKSLTYLAFNPAGTIPVLAEPEHYSLTQSLAILEYLEETVPEPALLPSDAQGRARVRSIASVLVADTNPLLTSRVRTYLTCEGGFDGAAWHAWVSHWLSSNLKALDWRLAMEPQTGEFCHGHSPTVADICLMSIAAVAEGMNIVIDRIPTIDRIIAACASLDAFARAQPLRQHGAPSTQGYS